MLTLLIHTYTPCVDYSPYQSNVFSNVVIIHHVFDHLMCIRCANYLTPAPLLSRHVDSVILLAVSLRVFLFFHCSLLMMIPAQAHHTRAVHFVSATAFFVVFHTFSLEASSHTAAAVDLDQTYAYRGLPLLFCSPR